MSPVRSTTATPFLRRTVALSSRTAIGRLLPCGVQAYDQAHRVVLPIGPDLEVVRHAADQEQAPAAGALLARELGGEVGRGSLRDPLVAALVDDVDLDPRGR